MQIQARSIVPWVAVLLLALSACGLDHLGVQSVEFSLEPTAVVEPPEGIDAALLSAIPLATGTVTVDVHDDIGMVTVSGLPALPDGFSYSVMLMFAHGDREQLPGVENDEGVGHAHGAVLEEDHEEDHEADDEEEHDDELEMLAIGQLMAQHDAGSWMAMFAAADIDDHTMGALRAGMIMLVPETGMPVMVMFGQVEETVAESGGEGGGHEHGA